MSWIVRAAVLLMFSLPSVLAQMSPGPLAQAHASLDSPLQCTSCHALGKGSVQFKCLDCHEEIKRRLAEKRGYHAKLVRANGNGANQECARCHAEHNGRQHQLVRWTTAKAKFDHRNAGWPLEGKHAALSCEKCHNPLKFSTVDKATMKRSDPGKSYLGLVSSCNICHADEHRGDLGTNCEKCHGLESWKNPPGFSHDKSAYPLTGLHQKVLCEKCHHRLPASTGRIQYKNFGFFDSCRACHKDVHGGSFAGDCQKCHSTSGWKNARAAEGGFDHSKTNFPLKGRHNLLDCKKCHRTENFRAPVAHAKCLDCHQDKHKGQFLTKDGGECAQCHGETAWKPARFTIEDHAATKYPLQGLHAKVACVQCHAGMGAEANYHPAAESCRNCHQDRHRGQFAAAPHENRCEHCHLVTGWSRHLFNTAAHRATRMPLTGAHSAVLCLDCHKRTGKPEETRFHFASTRCLECHESPHASAAVEKAGCESCHTTRNWKETGPFDHNSTGYPLAGKHRTAPCTGCHKPEIPGGKRLVSFHGTARTCGACHADAHDGQFQTALESKPDCGRCHTTTNWQPTGFDHQRNSTFSLRGAHERVPCRLCHDNRRQVAGRQVVLYRGTTRQCEECHR